MLNLATVVCGVLVGHSAIMPLPAADGADVASDVRAWLEREIAAAGEPKYFPGFRLDYRVEWHDVPSMQKVSDVRAAVKDHPDHPDRSKLAQWEAALAGKPQASKYSAWLFGPREWRTNNEAENGPFMDHAQSDAGAWQLSTGGNVKNFDTRATAPRTFAVEAVMGGAAVNEFFGAGLHSFVGLRPEVKSVVPLPDAAFRARVETHRPGGVAAEHEVTGRWLRDRAEVTSIVQVATAPGTGASRRYADWKDTPLGPAAYRVEVVRADGALEKVLLLTSVAPEPNPAEVVRQPTFERPDPIRNIEVRRIYEETIGTSRERDGPTLTLGPPEPSRGSGVSATRWLVWAGVPLVVVGLFVWRRLSVRAS